MSANAIEVLHAFVAAVNDAGGVCLDDDRRGARLVACWLRAAGGTHALGAAYMAACDELGLEPQACVPSEGVEWDGQEALDVWNRAREEGRLWT